MIAPSARAALRTQVDRCPGLLRPHRAADGALVRLRLPGGRIRAAALSALAGAAAEFGDGQVQLTSRGNLQLRGIAADSDGEGPAALVDVIGEAGLLPSTTHELIRNITCSPLTGRSGGLADLRGVVIELDEMLCNTPALAGLPGRFLFCLDDGRGDVLTQAHDLGLQAVSTTHAVLTIGGRQGPVVPLRQAVPLLQRMALNFLRTRGDGPSAAWHVAELPGAGASLVEDLALPEDSTGAGHQPAGQQRSADPDVGVRHQRDGRNLVAVSVPLGLLTPDHIRAVTVAAIGNGSGELIITPWRTLLIPDLTSSDGELAGLVAALEKAGLVTDPNSGWHGLSACTGAPGCAKAAAPTRQVAALLAGSSVVGPVHVVACERRCGSPRSGHVEVLVLPDSYRVLARRPGPQPSSLLPADRSAETFEPPAPTPVHVETASALIDAVAAARNQL